MSSFTQWLAVGRDLALVVLAVLGIVQVAALLVISVSLYREIRPILRRTRQILNNVQGTSSFVSETVVRPIIRIAGMVAAARGAAAAVGRFGRRRGGSDGK